ncbi:hypothetical protein [Pediococcus pentosaceus]|uniref:hypothetical protein n=1 Tax=Pediococcus pentosaceus TaxID=1255 RepID=UPI002E30AE47|nr:hypothetical protein [Pediococcus pentosaceus]
MYQYEDGDLNVTIILGCVTSIYYDKNASTFDIYLTDNGEPNKVPTRYYDDFMNKLSSYVKNQAQ